MRGPAEPAGSRRLRGDATAATGAAAGPTGSRRLCGDVFVPAGPAGSRRLCGDVFVPAGPAGSRRLCGDDFVPAGPAGSRRLRGDASARSSGERGQASVELVALLPVLVAVALAVGHVLAAGAAHELAGHAAEAGAIALLREGDAEDAARASVPPWARRRLEVRVRGRSVRVRVEPLAVVPWIADVLTQSATADLGPEGDG